MSSSVQSFHLLELNMVSLKKLRQRSNAFIRRFVRKTTTARVYCYDEDYERIRWTPFLRFYSAIGFIRLPKPDKYRPEFDRIFSEPVVPVSSLHRVFVKRSVGPVDIFCVECDYEPSTSVSDCQDSESICLDDFEEFDQELDFFLPGAVLDE